MQERPVVVVSTEDNASSLSAVTAVRSAIRVIFHVSEVHGTPASFARSALNLNVIYEVTFHIFCCLVVWLFCCFVVCYLIVCLTEKEIQTRLPPTRQQNDKTTRQQNHNLI